MLLAGDVGGTKTLLGLFARHPTRPAPVEIRSFQTRAFPDLSAMIVEFLRSTDTATTAIEGICVGVAGPVAGASARLTNIPWVVDTAALTARLSVRDVFLLNDLEAMAYAVPVFEPAELAVLQEGAIADGSAALIAAGTGLGIAILHHVARRFVAFPSEGGHADFAARTPREFALQQAITAEYGRAQWEHVVSGPGLVNIHRFLHPHRCPAIPAGLDPSEAPPLITDAALGRRCPHCVETLGMFVSAYGAAAGNLALAAVATSGLYVGGGIAPKILPALEAPLFIEAFRAKAPMEDLLRRIPVRVILNAQAGLIGAAAFLNARV